MINDANDVPSLELAVCRGAYEPHDGSFLGGTSACTMKQGYGLRSRENGIRWSLWRGVSERLVERRRQLRTDP